eukprot:TRINITY_DN47802_c0_g1_i1.p1 TRINITY_DN47802_c0_g1~~TRINITY_DN47802_c0_g1_i1.p1  ORF type:complete len:646 (-),score=103.62 TRINITY_DN47802_c0_g1_i1:46-1938(-)
MQLRAELQEERSERILASMHVHAIEEFRVAAEEQFKAELQQQSHQLQHEMHQAQAELMEEQKCAHSLRHLARDEMGELTVSYEELATEELQAVTSKCTSAHPQSEQLQQAQEKLRMSEGLVETLRAALREAELRAERECQRIETAVQEQCAKQALAEAKLCKQAERQRRATLLEELRQSLMLCEEALNDNLPGESSAMAVASDAHAELSEADPTEAGEEDDACSTVSDEGVSECTEEQPDADESDESESASEERRSRSPRRSSLRSRSSSRAQRRRGFRIEVLSDARLSSAPLGLPTITHGEVWRNQSFAGATHEDLVVQCTPLPEDQSQPRIVYEDDEVIVLYKPPDWTCTGSGSRCIQHFLRSEVGERLPFIFEHAHAGLAHRLDRDTSGPMVAATNRTAYEHLRRTVATESGWYKEYVALAHGSMPLWQLYGVVTAPVEDDPARLHKMRIADEDSRAKKHALSFYRVERLFQRRVGNGDVRRYSLMRFRIISGRTHQIRLHARHIFECLGERRRGVVCDDAYVLGRSCSNTYCQFQRNEDLGLCTRIFLHKTLLQLPRFWKMSRSLHVDSPLPSDLQQAFQLLEPDERDHQVQQFNRFVTLSTARPRTQRSLAGMGAPSLERQQLPM